MTAGARPTRRRPLIGTSWKMNLLPSTASAWFSTVLAGTTGVGDRELFVLPPFPMLPGAQAALRDTTLRWGAQDVHPEDGGAYTGDVSAPMLVDLGCSIAEIGHSERRRDHREGDARIAAKVHAALRWNLTPLLCVGERTHVDPDHAARTIRRQLLGALGRLGPTDLGRVVVAYEPVWAIGEGARAASLDHVARLHDVIRRWLDARGAPGAPVLYGGSVNPSNAASLLEVRNVDGLFVGRAALDPNRFVAIATLPLPEKESWA